jgi:hypothetical protein
MAKFFYFFPILFLLQVESYAATTITIRQVGSSVQAVATGSLDLTGLANTSLQNPGARVRGAGPGANVIIGFVADTPADGYTSISGPSVIGSLDNLIYAVMMQACIDVADQSRTGAVKWLTSDTGREFARHSGHDADTLLLCLRRDCVTTIRQLMMDKPYR